MNSSEFVFLLCAVSITYTAVTVITAVLQYERKIATAFGISVMLLMIVTSLLSWFVFITELNKPQ